MAEVRDKHEAPSKLITTILDQMTQEDRKEVMSRVWKEYCPKCLDETPCLCPEKDMTEILSL